MRDFASTGTIDLSRQTLLIYDEAAHSGSSWYQVGVNAGFEGDHLQVIQRAKRAASSYARGYRKDWPLPETDILDGSEALEGLLQGEEKELLRVRLKYTTQEEMLTHAEACAVQRGWTASLQMLCTGRQAYLMREQSPDWIAIGASVGLHAVRARKAAKAFAIFTDRIWPPRPPPPPWGALAYEKRRLTGMSWLGIGELLGRDWQYIWKEAQGYAVTQHLPWPLPLKASPKESDGSRIYLTVKGGDSWEQVATQFSITKEWAMRKARQYARSAGIPFPPRPYVTRALDDKTLEGMYTQREQTGMSWVDIAASVGRSYSGVFLAMEDYARRMGKPWPIVVLAEDLGGRGATAYRRGFVEGEAWEQVAADMSFSSVKRCRRTAQEYADRRSLPWYSTPRTRPQQAYEMKAGNPQQSWNEIRVVLGYGSYTQTRNAAALWARRNKLRWPL